MICSFFNLNRVVKGNFAALLLFFVPVSAVALRRGHFLSYGCCSHFVLEMWLLIGDSHECFFFIREKPRNLKLTFLPCEESAGSVDVFASRGT